MTLTRARRRRLVRAIRKRVDIPCDTPHEVIEEAARVAAERLEREREAVREAEVLLASGEGVKYEVVNPFTMERTPILPRDEAKG